MCICLHSEICHFSFFEHLAACDWPDQLDRLLFVFESADRVPLSGILEVSVVVDSAALQLRKTRLTTSWIFMNWSRIRLSVRPPSS